MNDCKNGDCRCGCCEGTEVLTPQSVANRPGLEALSYRTGTHAAFLETMKARLSSKEYPALRALTTRQEDDPAIALLDAGATMLDVLTFYQERIANEGYLRTATERRSVLELARLVGYKLRPGVAASVYLAFTLENGYETEIPAGTRAQSIPAPGELPQAFETSEPLQARAEWNILLPRMTRPTYITLSTMLYLETIYFVGTSTNLNPNDPLLFVFGTGEKEQIFRLIEEVEIEAAENRTKVTLQQMDDGEVSQSMRGVVDTAPVVNVIKATVEKYLDLDAFDVSADSQSTQDVVGLLEELSKSLDEEFSLDELINILDEILRQLQEVYDLLQSNWTKLLFWVGAAIAALQAIRDNLPKDNSDSDSTDESDDSGSSDHPGDSSIEKDESTFGKLDAFLDQLSKRPSLQPANAKRLTRNAETLYGAKADTLPRFLTAFNPQLKDVLYKAWANVKVRKDPTPSDPVLQNVYALRLKAAPFGHNAPLRPDYFDEARNLVVYGEWEIYDPLNQEAVPLKADFMACPQNGVAPLTVQFVDRSEGYAAEWDWDFNDDSENNSARDPQHTFSEPGSYNVTLKVKSASESDMITKTIIVTQSAPISAAFTADPVRGEAPLEVQFTDHSTGEIEEWAWDFGDNNNTSSEQNPLYQFDNSGTYTVTLTVRGPEGESTTEAIILVESGPIILLSSATHPKMVPGTETPLVHNYHQPGFIYLDSDYDILPESWVVIEPGLDDPTIVYLGENAVTQRSLAAYGLTGRTTGLDLGTKNWFADISSEPFSTVRGTTIYAQSEALTLAEEPILAVDSSADEVKLKSVEGKEIELDALYKGLEVGRWAIVSGERTDVEDESGESIPGVFDSELVMLAGVEQSSDQELPGDTPHTTIHFANNGLAYAYKRDNVTVYGNVVKATHGETRNEVLGSGDGSKALQTFTLKQLPLTYTSAPTVSGIESSLEVRVNDVRWPEADSLVWLAGNERGYITKTDNEDKTAIIFGDGKHGARLPTGLENIKAVYRNGIGKPGNVAVKQISLLATKPLGVKSVINPLPATGGADRENRDQARRNVPLAVTALDRLVSVQDYADFARTFAGIGKASAVELPDGRRMLVHLTIAGAEDILIDKTSDLFLNLSQALRLYGDPYQSVKVSVRELMLLVISANVRILPNYQWESVEPHIRAALLETFSFERRELGQDVMLSEVISVIQGIPGVAYVDIDIFDSVPETIQPEQLENLAETFEGPEQPNPRIPVTLAWVDSRADTLEERIRPAQLAYLSPEIPDTLILMEKAS